MRLFYNDDDDDLIYFYHFVTRQMRTENCVLKERGVIIVAGQNSIVTDVTLNLIQSLKQVPWTSTAGTLKSCGVFWRGEISVFY